MVISLCDIIASRYTGKPRGNPGGCANFAGVELKKAERQFNLTTRDYARLAAFRYALRKFRQARRLQLLASTDDLTGLPNRRALIAYAEHRVRQVQRGEGTLSVLMIDVDRFKRINDTHGHAIGDEVAGTSRRGRITVRTRRIGDYVEISIADTGPGIPESVRPRIFEPFVTTKEVGRGTGQGLALSRGIVVEKLKGSLHFETETGKGTTFFIRLPVSEPATTAASPNKQAAA